MDARDIPGRAASKATVHIKIGNPEEVDPVFSKTMYTFTVDEDADGTTPSIGQSVGTVSHN